MKLSDFITRARSAINQGTIYTLGQGGTSLVDWRTKLVTVPFADPRTDKPNHEPFKGASGDMKYVGECDCSGFVAWALNLKRQLVGVPWYDDKHNGQWLNTDAVVRDALSPYGFFDKIDAPEPGCVIVFGKQPGEVAGHIGIVSAVSPAGAVSVIHCSSGNYRGSKDAIRETGNAMFPKAVTVYARCAMIDKEN